MQQQIPMFYGIRTHNAKSQTLQYSLLCMSDIHYIILYVDHSLEVSIRQSL